MEHEAAQELFGGNRHLALLAAVSVANIDAPTKGAHLLAPIQVATEGCRTASRNGVQYAQMEPRQPGSVPCDEAIAVLADGVGHLEGWLAQVAAKAVGAKTRLRSLELGCEVSRTVGSCDSGYSCAYINSMSWRGPSTPNPPETNPRLVFERLSGTLAGNNDPQARARIEEDRKSILDTVTGRTRQFMAEVGPADRHKIDEYFSSIRDIEERIAVSASDQEAARDIEKPDGVPTGFVEHARLMNDLMLTAFRADITLNFHNGTRCKVRIA